jgi:hypothetical protein
VVSTAVSSGFIVDTNYHVVIIIRFILSFERTPLSVEMRRIRPDNSVATYKRTIVRHLQNVYTVPSELPVRVIARPLDLMKNVVNIIRYYYFFSINSALLKPSKWIAWSLHMLQIE